MACSEIYKPSKTLLKFSLRSQVKEYPRVAALHGIAYVADPTRPKAERIGWFICIVASTVAALSIIFTLMERFQTDPMMDSLELRFSDAPLNLPRFYVCPPWKSFDAISPEKKYDDTLYKRLYDWDFGQSAWNMTYPDSLDDTVYLKKFFKDNAPSCDQFIRNSSLTLSSKQEFNCSSFEMGITTGGICFILPSSGRIIAETPITFSFNTTMFPTRFLYQFIQIICVTVTVAIQFLFRGVQGSGTNAYTMSKITLQLMGQYWAFIAIHSKRVYATLENDNGLLRHLESFIFMFPATVTAELQETYTSPEAEVLTRSQRKCFFPGEQSPYIECVLDCRIANSLEYCDCVPWYLATDGTKECQIKKYECLDSNSAKIVDVSKCNCRQSCDSVVLKNTELKILSANEHCTIYIRARSLLKYKRTVRYGWSDLFVSFGGIAGLFLGCSLLSIIEFGYYFSLRTYCGAVLSLPKRRHNVIKINVSDTTHPVKNLTRDRERYDFHKKRFTFYDYVN